MKNPSNALWMLLLLLAVLACCEIAKGQDTLTIVDQVKRLKQKLHQKELKVFARYSTELWEEYKQWCWNDSTAVTKEKLIMSGNIRDSIIIAGKIFYDTFHMIPETSYVRKTPDPLEFHEVWMKERAK